MISNGLKVTVWWGGKVGQKNYELKVTVFGGCKVGHKFYGRILPCGRSRVRRKFFVYAESSVENRDRRCAILHHLM